MTFVALIGYELLTLLVILAGWFVIFARKYGTLGNCS